MAIDYSLDGLSNLLSRASLEIFDHESVLKYANNLPKISADNPQALLAKVTALLHLDRFDDALRVLDAPSSQNITAITFLERTYCLYKVGRLLDAIEVAQKGGGRALKHIAAQAFYRLERFDEVSKIYQSLRKSQEYEVVNEEDDIKINSEATEAQLIWAGRTSLIGGEKTISTGLGGFDSTFNAACLSIARDELTQAADLLKIAQELGNTIEGLSEADKLGELQPIIEQEIYILARTEKFESAAQAAKQLNKSTLSDESLKPIALNNEAAVLSRLPDYNPYLALKNAKGARKYTHNCVSLGPFSFQSRVLRRNESVLNLGSGKTMAAQKKAKVYHEAYTGNESAGVIHAAVQTAEHASSGVLKKIQTLFETDLSNIGLGLTLIQLRMNSRDITQSIKTMERLLASLEPMQRYQPGLIALLVCLFQKQGRHQHVWDILSEASDWWKEQSRPASSILLATAKSRLYSNNPADLQISGALFASILAINPSDQLSAAGIVSSYAIIEPLKARGYVNNLTAVEALIDSVDIFGLEATGVAQLPWKRGAESIALLESKLRKTSKNKRPRLPKEHDPTRKFDPERWLPMRDRSYYKPRGKRDRKKPAATTQGESSIELAGGLKVDVMKIDYKKVSSNTSGKGGKKKKKGKW